MNSLRPRFRDLHGSGTLLLANAWDVGSARILATMGFSALATTSAGFAASLGRMDQQITRDELVNHVAALTAAIDIPLNVDAENCFAARAEDIGETVDLLAEAGASGLSIEDWDPLAQRLESTEAAVERVQAAAQACARHGIVLTGRAENHLHGVHDLDDTIDRLQRYVAAGAEVAYAPGLRSLDQISRVVAEVAAPINHLTLRKEPTVAELRVAGVRRVSVGGLFAFAAYGALARAATELLEEASLSFIDGVLPPDLRTAAFAPRP